MMDDFDSLAEESGIISVIGGLEITDTIYILEP
jgi:hypothetical protein